MTTLRDGFETGVDAVIADPTLNQNGFRDAIRTVITPGFSNAEADLWIDALIVEYNRLGIINNPTYGNFRNHLISDPTKVKTLALWDAIESRITGLPETAVPATAVLLITLRDERDNVDAAITRFDDLIAVEPGGTIGKLVKDEMRAAKDRLRVRKQEIRSIIQSITGDPDS